MRHNKVPVVKREAVKGAHKKRPINCANIPPMRTQNKKNKTTNKKKNNKIKLNFIEIK